MLERKETVHEGCLCATGEIVSLSYFQKNERNKCYDGTVLFFLPGGLLDPREPSENKLYILCARRKKKKTALTKKDNNLFQLLFTDYFL